MLGKCCKIFHWNAEEVQATNRSFITSSPLSLILIIYKAVDLCVCHVDKFFSVVIKPSCAGMYCVNHMVPICLHRSVTDATRMLPLYVHCKRLWIRQATDTLTESMNFSLRKALQKINYLCSSHDFHFSIYSFAALDVAQC